MNKPGISLSFLLCTFIGLNLGCKTGVRENATQEANALKNVVFILVDDLGWNDLGVYGSTFHETPNLDRLAAESTLFTHAYTPNPVCSPTRAAIMSGKYPSRVGITDWIPGNMPQDKKLLGPPIRNELALDEVTLAESLRSHGYQTFFAGKWHLGEEGHYPEDQGFMINKGGHDKGSPPGGYYSPYKNPKLTDGPEGEYLTDRLTDESINFLRTHQEDPFLLYLSFYTVHTPIQADRASIEKFTAKQKAMGLDGEAELSPEHDVFTRVVQSNADYASMVNAMDRNVGRLLDTLEELGLKENTLVVFTSDNGGLSTLFPGRTAPTSVRPLRAGKGWLYEGGLRVPLIIRSPYMHGQRIHPPVVSMDLYPTVLDLLGLPLQPEQHMDGKSLKPLLKGEVGSVHESLFYHYPHYHGSGWRPGTAVRHGDWKLIYFYETDQYELYNLAEDEEEQHELSEQHPEKLAELKSELEHWLTETGSLTPTVNH
ncbi:MAG: sulfatase [Saprospiraceae bacterium]|nr:sulfatase [Lewinella sp.]